MCSLVKSFFQLILRISLNLILIAIEKGPRVFQSSVKKRFELVLGDRDPTFSVQLFFVLLPIEFDLISEKKDHKQNLVRSNSPSNSKMVFILLTNVTILYMGSTTIDVKRSSFEFVPKRSSFQSLEERLNDLIQVLLAISENVRSLRR